MNYIIVGRHGIPSIKSIYDKLINVTIIRKKNNTWKYLHRINNDKFKWKRLIDFKLNEEDNILRWGCTTPIYINGATLYNKSSAINLASNKYDARVKMKEKCIPVPKTYNLYDVYNYYSYIYNIDNSIMNIGKINFPVIVRPLKHSKGIDFKVFNNLCSLINWFMVNRTYNTNYRNFYLSELYNKTQEFRVHVAHGKILSIHEKPLICGIIQANHSIVEQPWKTLKWSEYKKDVCRVSCDAVKAIGLDCGAVDIMVNRSDGVMPICVCEINTCPSIDSSQYDQQRYAKYINWLFREKKEWFKYEEWNFGKSFAFKSQQLEG